MRAGDKEIAKKMFNLEDGAPTVLALGGGTGATRLNRLIWGALPILGSKVQIIHSTGKRKLETKREDALRYHHYEFLGDELAHAYAAADLVVSRAGMGTLTELSAQGMSAILVPISNTHQVDNAKYFADHDAAIYFDETQSSKELAKIILRAVTDEAMASRLGSNMKSLYHTDAASRLADLIVNLK